MHPNQALVEALPLHRHLGIQVTRVQKGESQVTLQVAEHVRNPVGVLHGGVIHLVCDVTAYLALLESLSPEQNAVTHDLHVSVLRPAPEGSVVTFEGKLRRLGKSLAFVDVEVQSEGKLIALARVTKTLVAMG